LPSHSWSQSMQTPVGVLDDLEVVELHGKPSPRLVTVSLPKPLHPLLGLAQISANPAKSLLRSRTPPLLTRALSVTGGSDGYGGAAAVRVLVDANTKWQSPM
jgi:hypothetical protein